MNQAHLAAMSANHLAFVRAQSLGPAGRLEESEALLVVETGVPRLNRVSLKRPLAGPELMAVLDGLRQRFAARQENWMLTLQPAANTPQTAATLQAAGFSLARDAPVMVQAHMDDPRFSAFCGDLQQVSDANSLADWQAVAACAYPFGGDQSDCARAMLAAMSARSDCRFWLRRAGANAPSCAMTLVSGQAAGLYWVATDPRYRQQGHAMALLSGVLAELSGLGMERAYLYSSSMARNLYLNLGFAEAGRLLAWEPPSAETAIGGETNCR